MTDRRRAARASCICALLVAAACSDDAYVLLQVDADLEIPGQVDTLTLLVSDPGDGAPLTEVDIALAAGDVFPVEVLLELLEGAPAELVVRTEALARGVAVARLTIRHRWQPGVVNVVDPYTLSPAP